MVNTLNRLVSPQRVKTILECYGADPAAWPEGERQAARALLERNHELQALRDQAMQLDAAIHALGQSRRPAPEHISALTERIMRALPGQTLPPPRSGHRRALGWLTGMAAGLAMAGLLFFAQQSGTRQDKVLSPLAQADARADIFYDWAWEDVTGESVADDTTDGDIFPLYALVGGTDE